MFFGSLGDVEKKRALRNPGERDLPSARTLDFSVSPSEPPSLPLTRRRRCSLSLSVYVSMVFRTVLSVTVTERCTMINQAKPLGVARVRSRARLRLADDLRYEGRRDKASHARKLLKRDAEKHTLRAAWRGVAASRMADWRRADNSRSVSALGRGRGDRCWLVTRAGGCSAEGKGF